MGHRRPGGSLPEAVPHQDGPAGSFGKPAGAVRGLARLVAEVTRGETNQGRSRETQCINQIVTLSNHWLIHVQARRARHDAMLATLREHAPGERDPAVVAGLVAWASDAFAGADPSALPELCQHLAVTERSAGDLLWLQGDVADKYYGSTRA